MGIRPNRRDVLVKPAPRYADEKPRLDGIVV
jgi:hypothetical protein